jgi:hypothetical protein
MRTKSLLALAAASIVLAVSPSDARAESIIKNPGDHPDYVAELEPHGLFGWGHRYGSGGFGLGVRATFKIVDNGFVKTINNSIGIGVGLDWVRYGGCYYDGWYGPGRYRYGCAGSDYFMIPVVMQWNFWLTTRWSVFGEPGFHIYHRSFDNYCGGLPGCNPPSSTNLDFAFYGGARFHFNETIALTMRIGYPTLSVGASFFF